MQTTIIIIAVICSILFFTKNLFLKKRHAKPTCGGNCSNECCSLGKELKEIEIPGRK